MAAYLYDVGYWRGRLWCSDHQCKSLVDAAKGRDNLMENRAKGSKRVYVIRPMELRYTDA